jgi:DNA-nicking Smr family endonuclease
MTDDKKTWKIGLDLHGVVSDMPEFFSFLTNALVNEGAEVHIITGGATEEDKKMLKDNNIKYTHYFSIIDHHKQKGTETHGKHPKYGFDMISDEEWDRTKGDYCREAGIDLHIDDTLIYNNFFTTPFCRFWSHNNHGKPAHKDPRYLD